MSDLAAFLTARLAEDEASARAASPGPWHLNAEGDEVLAVDDETAAEAFALSGNQQRATAAHIARHDPARVLREAEAKRVIISDHQPTPMRYIEAERCSCDRVYPCVILCALAAVYSDHPDYREEWRP